MAQIDDVERERREMAAALDCFTEQQVQVLADYAETTLENHRRRGSGPPYLVFGKTFLYPRAEMREYLSSLIRERRPKSGAGKAML